MTVRIGLADLAALEAGVAPKRVRNVWKRPSAAGAKFLEMHRCSTTCEITQACLTEMWALAQSSAAIERPRSSPALVLHGVTSTSQRSCLRAAWSRWNFSRRGPRTASLGAMSAVARLITSSITCSTKTGSESRYVARATGGHGPPTRAGLQAQTRAQLISSEFGRTRSDTGSSTSGPSPIHRCLKIRTERGAGGVGRSAPNGPATSAGAAPAAATPSAKPVPQSRAAQRHRTSSANPTVRRCPGGTTTRTQNRCGRGRNCAHRRRPLGSAPNAKPSSWP